MRRLAASASGTGQPQGQAHGGEKEPGGPLVSLKNLLCGVAAEGRVAYNEKDIFTVGTEDKLLKQLMLGNEAIARGAYEAGVGVSSAYPGTPSTEILENLAQYGEVNSR